MPGYIIGVAASAGGVAALSTLLGCLPENLPSPLLVVQHLPRTRPSLLREVLQRRTRLAVRWAESGESLEAGTVYLAPPDRHVSVSSGGTLVLSAGSAADRSRPAADILFRSLAAVFGPRAIGIVLTGCLGDGAEGAAAIRAAGGRVLVQDPEFCEQSSMPLAAMQTGAVDFCLRVQTLAAAMIAITMVPGASTLFSVSTEHRAALAEVAATNPNRCHLRLPAMFDRQHSPDRLVQSATAGSAPGASSPLQPRSSGQAS